MPEQIKTVANQRVITVMKTTCDKNHPYTMNNLEALDEAAGKLKTKAGFKLYIYLAKNQDKYEFALSSKAFIKWAGVGIDAYTAAFNELVANRYLIAKEGKKTIFTFYDKAQQFELDTIETVTIKVPKEQLKKIIQTKEEVNAAWYR